MIEKLIQSVALKLKTMYEGNIYVDKVPQGIKNGDLFILPINASREQVNGYYWRNVYSLDVHLFEENRLQGLKQSEEIKRLIEWVSFRGDGLPIRGDNISSTYIDGVAHVFITYVLDESIPATGEKMNSITYKGGLKE